jgi:hypothetical protein
VEPDWPTCEISDCIGVPTRAWGRCWKHQSRNDEANALARIAPGADLDLRGTTVTSELLKRILDRFRDSRDHDQLNIGVAQCMEASFDDAANFDEAIFRDRAGFAGATFGDVASFAGALFKGPADFAGAEFAGLAVFTGAGFCTPALFNGARFGGAKFTGVRFGGNLSFQDAEVANKLTLEVSQLNPGGTLVLDGLRGAGEVDVRAEVGTLADGHHLRAAVHCRIVARVRVAG